MPRNKCTQVIEHRLSFSDFERKELKEYLDELTGEKQIVKIQKIGITVAAVGGAAAVGYIGWSLFQWAKGFWGVVGEAAGTGEAAWKQTGIYKFFFT